MNSISLKVVTGIRRCGKSVLLEQYQDRLRAAGVEAEQIKDLLDYKALYQYISFRFPSVSMSR